MSYDENRISDLIDGGLHKKNEMEKEKYTEQELRALEFLRTTDLKQFSEMEMLVMFANGEISRLKNKQTVKKLNSK